MTDAPPPDGNPPPTGPPQQPFGYPPPVGYRPTVPGSGGASRIGLIVAVVLGVAVLLWACGVGAVVFVGERVDWGRQADAGRPPGRATEPATPSSSAGTSAEPLDCRVGADSTGTVTSVGQPDFASAPRTGTATMTITTNLGELTITMDRAKTPCAVASLQYLAAKGFYAGSTCHRLVDGGLSILQCGDPAGDGTGNPGYTIADENLPTVPRYPRGTVALANTGYPDTNSCQFFIVFADTELTPNSPVIGTVSAGLEIVDRVAAGGHDGAFDPQPGGGHPRTKLTFQRMTIG